MWSKLSWFAPRTCIASVEIGRSRLEARRETARSLPAAWLDSRHPLFEMAQLHDAHYKCSIYFDEVKRVGWRVPHTLRDEEAVEIIYIDQNHFHVVGNVDIGVGTPY